MAIEIESFSQQTLRRVKENDSTLRVLRISDIATPNPNHGDVGMYVPDDRDEFEALGECIGRNTYLECVCFDGDQDGMGERTAEIFATSVRQNESISRLSMCRCNLAEGTVLEIILKGFGARRGRGLVDVSIHRCRGIHALASSLSTCANVKNLRLTESRGTLRPHNGLLLNHNDASVTGLVSALAGHRQLVELDLRGNDIIETSCCSALAALLRDPKSSLVTLRLENNFIDSDGARMLANALMRNERLQNLYLHGNPIFGHGLEEAFSKALCDTTSIRSTFLSNHTLQSFVSFSGWAAPSYLELNRSSRNKRAVAALKILRHHDLIDMRPFFGMDLKVLPVAMAWFALARACSDERNAGNVDRKKLCAMYQFAVAMPMMFVPGNGPRSVREPLSGGRVP